jgi:hypothetical protein
VGDDLALADALRRVLTRPALVARLRVAGDVLARRHGWDTIADRHRALYRRFGTLAAR